MWNISEYHFQFHISPSARQDIPQNYMKGACGVFRGHLALFSRAPSTNTHTHTCSNSTCRSIGTFYKNSPVHTNCRLIKYYPDFWQKVILSFCTDVGPICVQYLLWWHSNTMAHRKFTLHALRRVAMNQTLSTCLNLLLLVLL